MGLNHSGQNRVPTYAGVFAESLEVHAFRMDEKSILDVHTFRWMRKGSILEVRAFQWMRKESILEAYAF